VRLILRPGTPPEPVFRPELIRRFARRLMSEAQSPLEDASDPLEAPAATPPAATGPKPRHKRLATLAGSFLAIIAIASYFYWLMVRDEHTTAQIQKEFKAEGVQVIFSQAEPREEASLSPFQTMSQTV
jgi:hypothetical protein